MQTSLDAVARQVLQDNEVPVLESAFPIHIIVNTATDQQINELLCLSVQPQESLVDARMIQADVVRMLFALCGLEISLYMIVDLQIEEMFQLVVVEARVPPD